MTYSSPTKFPSINDDEFQAIRQQLMVASYACKDNNISKDELFTLTTNVHGACTQLLVKTIRNNRAAAQKDASKTQQLIHLNRKLNAALQEIEVLHSTAAFCNDEIRTSPTPLPPDSIDALQSTSASCNDNIRTTPTSPPPDSIAADTPTTVDSD
ncbi:unnamed protein product [Pleuronectes platessa]|uniref:Uncharacterized protein n=1 Tax=Pleuronectes platessa TaxID=8262 RepID=A0A9N7V1R2_PLEPL|nr:unnamed protein product [Pleuronectes platessa]